MSGKAPRPSLASMLSALRESPVGLFAFRPDGSVRSLVHNRSLAPLRGRDLRQRGAIGGVSERSWRAGTRRVLAGLPVNARLETGEAVADLRIEPWRDAAGRVIGGVGIDIDVTEREQALAHLEERQRRLRRITDHMGDVLVELDPCGALRFVTPSLRELLQREPEEVRRGGLLEHVHPDDRARVRETFEEVVRTGRGTVLEARILRRDGSVRWSTSRAELVRGADGEPRVLLFVRDVTEAREQRRRRERHVELVRGASELSHELLALAPESLDRGLERAFARVCAMTGADGCVLQVLDPHTDEVRSRSFARAGAPPPAAPRRSEAVRMAWMGQALAAGRAVHVARPEDLPPEAEEERRFMETRGVASLLTLGVRSDEGLVGSFSLIASRSPRCFPEPEHAPLQVLAEMLVGAYRRKLTLDATERGRMLEARVARLSQRLIRIEDEATESAFPDAMELALHIARADLALLRLPAAEGAGVLRRFARPEGEALPTPDPADLPWLEAECAAGRPVDLSDARILPEAARAEQRALRALGVGSCLAVPVQPAGSPSGWLAVLARDPERRWSEEERGLVELVGELLVRVLDRAAAEQRLRTRQAELRQSQKMDAVGRLAGGIAHEFNNVLMVISGHAESLRERLAGAGEAGADLREIEEATRRAAALTRQLLTLSGPELGRPRPVRLDSLIRAGEAVWRRTLGGACPLELRLEAQDAAVQAEPADLEQILLNLLVNARDAMPGGGRVLVTTRRVATRGEERGEIELCVQDEGEGISDAHLPHIFEPFYSTKPAGRGTGLGLSIVRHAADRLGARMQVTRGGEGGTCFRVRMPESTEAAAESAAGRPAAPKDASGTVLLAEDEDGVRRLMRRILQRAGYAVIEARDGAEALERVMADPERIDVVVSDVVMPRLGGGGLQQALRERGLTRPMLFVSGYPQEVDGPADTSADAPLLYKPFTADELLAAVAELLT